MWRKIFLYICKCADQARPRQGCQLPTPSSGSLASYYLVRVISFAHSFVGVVNFAYYLIRVVSFAYSLVRVVVNFAYYLVGVINFAYYLVRVVNFVGLKISLSLTLLAAIFTFLLVVANTCAYSITNIEVDGYKDANMRALVRSTCCEQVQMQDLNQCV